MGFWGNSCKLGREKELRREDFQGVARVAASGA